jgi:hypothetical protein
MEWWIDGKFIADNNDGRTHRNEYALQEAAQEEFDRETLKYLGLLK